MKCHVSSSTKRQNSETTDLEAIKQCVEPSKSVVLGAAPASLRHSCPFVSVGGDDAIHSSIGRNKLEICYAMLLLQLYSIEDMDEKV